MAMWQWGGQRQGQGQTQGLAISQKMQQALKLLHLSNLELMQHISAALEANPFLELPPERAGEVDPSMGTDPRQDEANFDDMSLSAPMRLRTLNDSDDDEPQEPAAEAPSLRQHLIEQLMLNVSDSRTQVIGVLIIDGIGDNGYLMETFEEMAARISVPIDEIARVHAILLGFDPTGVAARNVAECLEMQMRERGWFTPAAATLLQNLDLVAKRDLRTLRKLCDLPLNDLEALIAQVKTLNPKPGNAYGVEHVSSIIPDIIVRRIGGLWQADMSEVGLPRPQINREYYKALQKQVSAEEKAFLQDNYRYADWLVKSLDRREKTILRVADQIVLRQQGFFEHGLGHLQPLTLKSVADALELHESTISRVTAGKYLRCPRGVFELKFFFMSSVSAAGDDSSVSSQTVKHRIRTLIDNEPAHAVLSDDDLKRELERLGIRIARRTVSKYREAMKIAGARERRRKRLP